MTAFPALFVSHGAPNMVLHASPVREFLAEYTSRLDRPTAILLVSAHFEMAETTVVADPRPEMIYDFGGFEPELRTLNYPAPGAPELAEKVARAISAAGIAVTTIQKRGYDHGVWVPLMLMYPQADIPVAQLSVRHDAGPAYHYRLGAALRDLRGEGVLIIGSGSFTHNLHEVFGRGKRRPIDDARPDWVGAFVDWMEPRIEAGAIDELLAYRANAPFAAENHPTDEHLMPLYVALGAAGASFTAEHLHQSHQYGVLHLDAYAFH